MQIVFRAPKLAKLCNSNAAMVRKFGPTGAKRLRQRLADIEAADTAAQLLALPGRWHPLRGDRSGQMSADLDHPMRLIIEPVHPNEARLHDGGIDWSLLKEVVVVEVTDTHN